jgi:hypothetical protein
VVLKRLLFIVLFASLASALSLHLDSDSASIYGTSGSVFVWVVNDQNAEGNVAFSADTGILNGYFDDSFVELPADGAKGTRLHFSAPDCARGPWDVVVKAQVTDSSGVQQTLSKRLRVFAYPSGDCNYHMSINTSEPAFTDGVSTGDGSIVGSRVTMASYFDPTTYDVSLDAGACKLVKQGQFVRQRVWITNRGAAATFELRLVGPYVEKLNAGLSQNTVSLQRGEVKEIFVDATPAHSAHGRLYASVQAYHNGMAVSQEEVCFDMDDYYDGFAIIQRNLEAKSCEPLSFEGVLFNNGTADDVYSIETSKGRVAIPQFSLEAGRSASFRITILPEEWIPGENPVWISIKSLNKPQVAGSDSVLINVKPCVEPAANAQVSQTEQKDDLIKYVVRVQNDFDYALENVTATVAGIPAAWQVTADAGVVVPAKETRDVTVWVKQSTEDEAAAPVVVVKNNGTPIAQQSVAKIPSRTTSLTGFVTVALSQNSLLIAGLVLVALVVVVLMGRRGKTDEEKYKEKIEQLRQRVLSE